MNCFPLVGKQRKRKDIAYAKNLILDKIKIDLTKQKNSCIIAL